MPSSHLRPGSAGQATGHPRRRLAAPMSASSQAPAPSRHTPSLRAVRGIGPPPTPERRAVPLRYASPENAPPCEGYLLAKWKKFTPFNTRKRFYFVLRGTALTCLDDPNAASIWEEDIANLDLAVRKRGREPELVLEENQVVLLRLIADRSSLADFTKWFLALRKVCKASFDKFYLVGDKIGKGHYAQVFQARDKTTKDLFAVKVLDKSDLSNKPKFIEREKDIMKHVFHPNIVRTYDVFETDDRCYIVMELCQGGRLFDVLLAAKFFGEPEARGIMRQILPGIAYLHQNGIVHRDLKAENVLLHAPVQIKPGNSSCPELANPAPGLLKISDFGLSRRTPADHENLANAQDIARSCAGTPQYIAPEILLRNPYSSKADVWSLGVLLYVLLTGTYPFMADKVSRVLEKVAAGQIKWNKEQWKKLSPDAMALVKSMLSHNPDLRPSIEQVMASSWIGNVKPAQRPMSFTSLVTCSGDSVDRAPLPRGVILPALTDDIPMHMPVETS